MRLPLISRSRAASPLLSLLPTLAVLSALLVLAPPARAQPADDAGVPPLGPSTTPPQASPEAVALRPGPLPRRRDDAPQFGRALAGSTLGAAVGGLLGAALLTAAEPNENDLFADDEPDPRGLGLLFIAGGAPVGAVLNTDIPRDHTGAYLMGVLGEITLGGAGAVLGSTIGGPSARGRRIGGFVLGGVGVVLGAAGGAVLAAPDGPSGALHYEHGTWRVQPPSVRIDAHRHPQPGLHGTVSLVRVEL